jgi:hypothetical protein
MDKRSASRRVAARWALQAALGDWQPAIPDWFVPWADHHEQRVVLAWSGDDETVPGKPPVFTPDDPLHTNPNRRKYEPNYVYNPQLHRVQERVTYPGQDVFDEAKLSIEIMLPTLLKTLEKKLHDRFYMNATQQRMKLYYYFSGHPALETFALTLSVQGGSSLLWFGYIPNKLLGGADFQKAIHDSVRVSDPEVAGLALMRLVRKLLTRID